MPHILKTNTSLPPLGKKNCLQKASNGSISHCDRELPQDVSQSMKCDKNQAWLTVLTRASTLTKEQSILSLKHLHSPTTTSSLLFMRLPAELRGRVYEELSAGVLYDADYGGRRTGGRHQYCVSTTRLTRKPWRCFTKEASSWTLAALTRF